MNIQVIAQNVQLDDVVQVVEIDLREKQFITENTEDDITLAVQEMLQTQEKEYQRNRMQLELINNILREIQRRSHKAARDHLYEYQKYLQNMYTKIERVRNRQHESAGRKAEKVEELKSNLHLLCSFSMR